MIFCMTASMPYHGKSGILVHTGYAGFSASAVTLSDWIMKLPSSSALPSPKRSLGFGVKSFGSTLLVGQ